MNPHISEEAIEAQVLVCVLAAGASSRMGFPKLLAPYPGPNGSPTCLLERACRAALDSRAAQVAVVTGAHAGEMGAVLKGFASPGQAPARLVELYNDAWQQGQSASVRLATAYACKHDFDAVVFMAADQPFVEAAQLDALIGGFEGAEGIEEPGSPEPSVACGRPAAPAHQAAPRAYRSRCNGRQGNPCLFPRDTYPLLATVTGDEGARQLFRSGALTPAPVDIPQGAAADAAPFPDLDTPEAFEEFVRSRRQA